MNRKSLKNQILTVATFFTAVLLVITFPILSKASTYDLNFEFSGGTSPTGSPPWLRATFTDGIGGVDLQLTSLLKSSSEFVGVWYFNLNPSLNPANLGFAPTSGTAADAVGTGINAFKADGDGEFDIGFFWDANTFVQGSSALYHITSSEVINALSFDFFSNSAPGNGTTWHTAAHVQGIPIPGAENGSGFIGDNPGSNPVPEPATMLLLGSGLIGLAGLARKKFRK